MARRYALPCTRAHADIELGKPGIRRSVLGLMRVISGVYLRLAIGCRNVTVQRPELLVELFRAALAGEIRLIIAFRHPYVDEPQILGGLFVRGIEREARRLGVVLSRKPHALFVHGYEVPRWSGALVRWLLPRVGALPVHHSRMDVAGLARIKSAITTGLYPLALAPEGQVSYSSETVPRLESGTVRLGLEAAQQMVTAGRSEPVVVLPLSVHRRYDGKQSQKSLERLLSRTERFVGLSCEVVPDVVDRGSRKKPRPGDRRIDSQRMERIIDKLLDQAELVYPCDPEARAGSTDRQSRLVAVVEQAVQVGERMLGIGPGHSGIIERVYRIRQSGWDRIYLQADPDRLAPLARAIADRRAGEAWYAMRHMELADFAWYFRTTPPDPQQPFDLFAEYVQNLWDFANRLAGGAIVGRRVVRPFRALLVPAPTINLSDRIVNYGTARKATVAEAMNDLTTAYEACIREARTIH
jgi:hypothetical protein